MMEREISNKSQKKEVCPSCGTASCLESFPGLRRWWRKRMIEKGRPVDKRGKCRPVEKVCPSCGYNPGPQAMSDVPGGISSDGIVKKS